MNGPTKDEPSLTRKVTDAGLLLIAVAALASWLWRRVRQPASVDTTTAPDGLPAIEEKVGTTAGFPSNSTNP